MRRLLARMANLFRTGAAERDLSREVDSHLALIQEDFERRGMPSGEARLAARREYGSVEQAKELHRDTRSFSFLEHAIKDVRYGWRNLLRTPGFTLIAILTLAVGIGANTAVFSVVNAVLLSPLAYRDADQLVTVLHDGNNPVAVGNYVDWRDDSKSFEAMAAAEAWGPNLTGSTPPEHLNGLQVTMNLLPMLGVQPMMGRFFTAGGDRVGAPREVMLSYRLWQRRFSGDYGVLGKAMNLDGSSYTIVGVMPADFKFAPFWATRAEIWAPDAFGDRVHSRGGNSLRLFARLKPGSSVAQAQADITTLTTRLEHQFPGTNRNVKVTSLKENVVGKIEAPLLLVLGAVCFVLLMACANVAHMLLARTSDRRKEIAVRTALGASRKRILSQFLIENLMLAGVGAAVGLLLAFWGTRALVALGPTYIPRVETVGVDGRALLFLLGITCSTGLAFGLVPAMQAAGADPNDGLKEGGRGDSEGVERNRLRMFLVISEFALAFTLLLGAGLMIRSFLALQSVDPGFNPHQVVSMVVSVAGSSEAAPGRRSVFYRALVAKIRGLGGVVAAGAINHLPLAGDLWGYSFVIEGRPKPLPGDSPHAVYRAVLPGYFETMRLPVANGRTITDKDDSRAPDVVIINESAARVFWPGQNPVGKRISFDSNRDGSPAWVTIVGVTKNAAEMDWGAPTSPEIYLPALQSTDLMENPAPHFSYLTFVARTVGNPADVAASLKRTVWSFDPNLPISEVLIMDRVVADANAQPRFEMLLLGIFAAIALLLAAVGIYGVVSYSVARRTREIGIRMSLGAGRSDVLALVLKQAILQALTGILAGAAGASLLAKAMANMLYGVRPSDPATVATVAAVLGAAAILATIVPVRRIFGIEPTIALRSE